MADRTHTSVAVDANVLINLIHIARLDLLGGLPGMTFVAPTEVINEITDSAQARTLQKALASDHLGETTVTDLEEMEHYVALTRTLGKGESACLAVAKYRGWSVASDEKRLFRRTAVVEIGEPRILTTPDLIVRAIRAGLTTVEEADQWKRTLELHRFKMKFESFAEFL